MKPRWPLALLLLISALTGTLQAAGLEKDLCQQNFDGYRDKLTKNPDDADTWDELRVCASILFRWNDAAQIAAAAIQNKSQRPEPHIILGQAHLHAKEYDQAAAEFKQATVLKPDMPLAYAQLGLAEIYLKQPKDAAEAGERAAQLDPSNPAYHHQLAFSYYLLHQDDRCEAEAKKAIALDNNDIAAYKVLGSLYTRQGKTTEAEAIHNAELRASGQLPGTKPTVVGSTMPVAAPVAAASPFAAPSAATAFVPVAAPSAAPAGAAGSAAVGAVAAVVPSVPVSPSAAPATKPGDLGLPVHLEHKDIPTVLAGQWESMKIAALKGDIPGTLAYYSDYAETRDLYRTSFERMGADRMRDVFSRLGELVDCEVVFETATCKCTVQGSAGTFMETTVRFERNTDKVWRVKSF